MDIYTSITESTAYGALDRVLKDLNALTNGEAEKAIACVEEYNELKAICTEIEKRKAEKAEKEKTTAEQIVYGA